MYLVQTEDMSGLRRLLSPEEFQCLKPLVLLVVWEHVGTPDTGRRILDVLWDPEVKNNLKMNKTDSGVAGL